MLGQGWRRQKQVSDIGAGPRGPILGRDQPAQSPSWHGEVFGKRVYDVRIRIKFQHGADVRPVAEAMIDFV